MKIKFALCLLVVMNVALPVMAQPTSAPPNYYVEKLACESQNGQYVECSVLLGIPFDVILEKQISNDACVRGQSFGLTKYRAMWVDHNCRGLFKVLSR